MKSTLVFGASLKPHRISHQVVKKLRSRQINTSAFGVEEGHIDGVQVITNLNNLQSVHTISLYISPPNQPEYFDQILSLNPNRVIFNPGTENPEFYKLLRAKDIEVEIACTLTMLALDLY
ncbi:MAG: CoA-binding protein [Eudoraea sp.]|nr:CoA-binding protein [Eudoraea sp.]